MQSTLTVMHLTSSRFYGGPERQMLGLSQALLGQVKTVVASFSEGGLNQSFLSRVHEEGFTGISLQNDTPNLVAAYKEVASLIRQHSIDVLICHGYKAGLVGWFAAKKTKVPAIAVSRGWTYENWKVRLYEKIDRWMLRRMDKVVCVSQAQADKVADSGVRPERIEVIRNSVFPERFESRAPAYRTSLLEFFPVSSRSKIKTIVAAAGRLSPEKGFDVLVEAAAKIHETHDEVGFVLFGDGPLHQALSDQIRNLGIESRFVLAGFTSELDKFMPHFDLFVQSSHTEGLPNVLLEAAAAGVPVVATDVGGTSELVIQGETGILVSPNNPGEIAASLQRLVTHEPLRVELKSNASANVTTCFTFAVQATAYRRVFHSLLQHRASVA